MVLKIAGYTEQVQGIVNRLYNLYNNWYEPFRIERTCPGNMPEVLLRRVSDMPGTILRSTAFLQAIQDAAWNLLTSPVILSEFLGPSPIWHEQRIDQEMLYYLHFDDVVYLKWASHGHYSVSSSGLGITIPYPFGPCDVPQTWVQCTIAGRLGLHRGTAQKNTYTYHDEWLTQIDTLIKAIETSLPTSIPFTEFKIDITVVGQTVHFGHSWFPAFGNAPLHVQWGDGSEQGTSQWPDWLGTITHTYYVPGTYTVKFRGIYSGYNAYWYSPSRAFIWGEAIPTQAYDLSELRGVYCTYEYSHLYEECVWTTEPGTTLTYEYEECTW